MRKTKSKKIECLMRCIRVDSATFGACSLETCFADFELDGVLEDKEIIHIGKITEEDIRLKTYRWAGGSNVEHSILREGKTYNISAFVREHELGIDHLFRVKILDSGVTL